MDKGTATHAGRPASSVGIPVRNGILAALLATEYKRLLPKLEHVMLKRGQIVYRADQKIEEVYFPEEAVIAMVDTTADNRTTEVGIVGREGIVGINIFLGGAVTPDRAIVQLAGGAMRMKSKHLRDEVRFGSPLQQLLLGYTRTLLAVISQSVACSQHHSVEQRVARWMLTMNDYAGSGEFLMVHASIAAMLGVRRVGVTGAAQKLQAAGLISYGRGNISVLDKASLENESCECYRFIRRQYEDLHRELPRLLSRKNYVR
jgi:CRP-like cAMP-binding protein